MMPKVGQLLRWVEYAGRRPVGGDDVGIVKEVRLFQEDNTGPREYDVIIDWCNGPHHSYHTEEEYFTSVENGEIVVVNENR